MKHDLKLKQKRLWIDHWTKKPTKHEFVVLWIGKEIAAIRFLDGEERGESIDLLMNETIDKKKVRKDIILDD